MSVTRGICNAEDRRIARAAVALSNGEDVGFADRSRVMEFLHVNGFDLDFPAKIGEYAFAELHARYRMAYRTLEKISGHRSGFSTWWRQSCEELAFILVVLVCLSTFACIAWASDEFGWLLILLTVGSIIATILTIVYFRHIIRFLSNILVCLIRSLRSGLQRIEKATRPLQHGQTNESQKHET